MTVYACFVVFGKKKKLLRFAQDEFFLLVDNIKKLCVMTRKWSLKRKILHVCGIKKAYSWEMNGLLCLLLLRYLISLMPICSLALSLFSIHLLSVASSLFCQVLIALTHTGYLYWWSVSSINLSLGMFVILSYSFFSHSPLFVSSMH